MAQTNAINNRSNTLTVDDGLSVLGGGVSIASSMCMIDSTGVVEINSSGGALSIGNDADAQNINIGTGAAARTITVGNNTGATAVNVDIGTGDFTMTSGAGTLISQLNSGEMTRPLQPAFLAYRNSTVADVTGAGTVYTATYDVEAFDQGGDFDGTSTFTAPVTGRYTFTFQVRMSDLTTAMTRMTIEITTTPINFVLSCGDPGAQMDSMNSFGVCQTITCNLTAADTVVTRLVIRNGAGDTADFGAPFLADIGISSYFSGYLTC